MKVVDAISAEHSYIVVGVAGGLLILLAAVCLKIKDWTPGLLKLLYGLIAGVVILSTGYLIISTIQLNVNSSSGGPVHWHADFEVYSCGQELDLVDPKGWSNKVGTPTLHEHNDKRIHQEGVVQYKQDDSLGNFFKVVGGQLTSSTMIFPTNSGKQVFISGQACPDGRVAQLLVFTYRVSGKNYSQYKISNPENFIMASESQVPPGDCYIIEFDSPKDKTDKLCRSYQVAKQIGKLGEEIP